MTENISPTDSSRRSKRFGKAAVAGGIAVALLAGGSYTFARWYDQQELTKTSISTGQLKLAGSGGNCRLVTDDPASKDEVTEQMAQLYADNTKSTALTDQTRLVPDDYVVCQAADANGITVTAKGNNIHWKLDWTLGSSFTEGGYAAITAPDPAKEGEKIDYAEAIQLLGSGTGTDFLPTIKLVGKDSPSAGAQPLKNSDGYEGTFEGQAYYGFHISASSTADGKPHTYDKGAADPTAAVNDDWWHKALQDGKTTKDLFDGGKLTVKQIQS